MSAKRQFKAGPKTRTFFDRKVRYEGHTRSLSLSKVIPDGWRFVRIRLTKQDPDKVSIIIENLMGGEKNEPKRDNNKL